jgi:hypothetical protein
MYGDTVQLLQYKITQTDTLGVDYCASTAERDAIVQRLGGKPHSVEVIDQTGNEWIDGMAFADASKVPEALAIGESAYRQSVNDSDANLQIYKYLTDLDFRLLLLEWGVL